MELSISPDADLDALPDVVEALVARSTVGITGWALEPIGSGTNGWDLYHVYRM